MYPSRVRFALVVFFVALIATCAVQPVSAAILYATSLEGQKIFRVDTDDLSPAGVQLVTNAPGIATGSENTVAGPDSLLIDTAGHIVYTVVQTNPVVGYNGGNVFNALMRFDGPINSPFTPGTCTPSGAGTIAPCTLTDTLTTSGLFLPKDITLDPTGNTAVFSDTGHDAIKKINLTTNVVTTLTAATDPDGLIFVGARLFVNFNNRLNEINPTTGAIISSSGVLSDPDGITFDASLNRLVVASFGTGCIYFFDPNAITGAVPTCVGTGRFGLKLDGMSSDGQGHEFAASRGDSSIYEYDVATDTVTKKQTIFGLDDITQGTGSVCLTCNQAPEPSSWTLMLIGAGLVFGASLRRRSRLDQK